MQSKRLISVIIPFYNIGKHITKTINSLECQTYKNFEVIFVNDASTDDSLEIIKTLLKNVSFKYKIINKTKNGGPSPARNIGLISSQGEYIYFLDSDDIISENAFKEIIELFTSENPDILFFKFKRIDENGNILQHYNDLFKDVKKIEKSRDILIQYINLEIFLYTCSVVYKKEIIKDISFNENNETHYYIEDQDFTIRALLKANRIGYINSELIQYCKREGSIMNSKFNIKRLNKIRLFNGFYNQYNPNDEELGHVFMKRRTKEVLWVTRSYIKNKTEFNTAEIRDYIKKNILNKEISSYLDWVYLKKLNIKVIIQGLLLKYFTGLFVRLTKLI